MSFLVAGCTDLLNEARLSPRFSESAQVTSVGLHCSIDQVFQDTDSPSGWHLLVSLVNDGPAEYAYRSDSLGIRFSLTLEVYDARKRLILTESLVGFHSPYSMDRSKWPVLRVPPGQRVTEGVPLALRGTRENGVRLFFRDPGDSLLPPGTYYVRVTFPFEESKYYGSNLVRWDVPADSRAGTDQPEALHWVRSADGQWIEDKK
jgi:hypothetical protein